MNLELIPNNVIMVDLNKIGEEYVKEKMREILLSKTQEEFEMCINRIYEEGFSDGVDAEISLSE